MAAVVNNNAQDASHALGIKKKHEATERHINGGIYFDLLIVELLLKNFCAILYC
jgi:hypothetical protein